MKPYALAITCGASCDSWFVDSLIRLIAADNPPVIFVRAGPLPHRNRNMAADLFINGTWDGEPAERLVFLDSDIVFSVADMHKLLSHDKDIVSGVYANEAGVMMQIGAGFMAIKRHVIEALMPHPFNPVELDGGVISGEDVGFHMNANKAGFESYVDQELAVGHAKVQILRIVSTGDRPVERLDFSRARKDPPVEVEAVLPLTRNRPSA